MNYKKRVLAMMLAAALTLPAFSCKKDGDSSGASSETRSTETIPLNTDENKNIQMDVVFKEVENDSANDETEPVASIVTGENGSLYVQKTDINHKPVTEQNGDPATEVYTGTTLATKVPDPEYKPAYKTYFSMWIDTTKKSDFVFDGEFLTFDIKISEDAKDGVYPIQIYKDDVATYGGETLKVTQNPGYICVNSEAPSPENKNGDGLTLNGSVVSGKPGDVVKYTVNAANNPGFAAFRLWMNYDSNLFKVTRAQAGKDFTTTIGLDGRTVSDPD
ncbi:MAG: hypothetical protein II723_02550 [Oscillospiraceae bacterium]|nr:hypothetical protein [Oscillospiraceae bacterium]